MSNSPPILDAVRFPLSGSQLIEASAGTGKTFTIATLYVRLILGHGTEMAVQARAYTPPEILVVTFTDAATQELREAIRTRLTQAIRLFQADPALADDPQSNEILLRLRADYPPEQWPQCVCILQQAAAWMDEAAVSTIHAWCYRMLREHAFAGDHLLQQTLETDLSALVDEAVRDYWRIFLIPLDACCAATVRGWWREPSTLQQDLKPLIAYPEALPEDPPPAHTLPLALQARQQQLAALKAPWLQEQWVCELNALLEQAVANNWVDKRKLQARYYQPWLESLEHWVSDSEAVMLDLKTGFERLTPQGLQAAWKATDQPAPNHPALQAIDTLKDDLDALPDGRTAVLSHAARWVAERVASEKIRRAQMGFDDLLTRLDQALAGANGAALAALIRRQFPVVLIDEFQDTDPIQYRIFDAIYAVADNRSDCALILIGDPKQSIYAFRGADIYTYLAARQGCGERLHTLNQNYRSTHAMVAAVNRCFGIAEERADSSGAFLFRTETGNPLPFWQATAAGREQSLHIEGQAPAALNLWLLATEKKKWTKTAYREQAAEIAADTIASLLQLGQTKQAGLVSASGLVPLQPNHLAVLVNSRTEAALMRQALNRHGVRSVYLSEQDSVFHSPQAEELLLWLHACAQPDDSRALRAALASPTLGLSLAELDHLQRDELAWEARVVEFRRYRELWRLQGVLPMLRHLLHRFAVPARLLDQAVIPDAERSGERVLTDLLHLAELLQEAGQRLEGEQRLIRYLAEQCAVAEQGASGQPRQIRLESDEHLVQIVTIHKAKGLQYPLVFLPFVADHRPVTAKDCPLKWHDAEGRLQIALEASAQSLEHAQQERLGEDLRKLYVALTRAQYATWVGLAALEEIAGSAWGHLLAVEQPHQFSAAVQQLASTRSSIAVFNSPTVTATRFQPQKPALPPGAPRQSRPVAGMRWWIASYSSLCVKTGGLRSITAEETATAEQVREWQASTHTTAARLLGSHERVAPVPYSPHAFMRGPEAGTFLHDLLEWAAHGGFGDLVTDSARLRDTIARRCQPRGWERWIDPLTDWMLALLGQPLHLPSLANSQPLRLAQLTEMVAEMEFWLAAHQADLTTIDQLVCAQTLAGSPRPALQPNQINGLLKGFIDLLFKHQGRYFVMDYKSNWLGPNADFYTEELMRAEIAHARYDLQFVLYVFALHRLLQSRLPNYDYDRDVGGAVYFFLRGIDAPSQGIYYERPPWSLIADLEHCFAAPARIAA